MPEGWINLFSKGGPLMYPLSVIGFLILSLGLYQIAWLAVWTLTSERYSCAGAPMWARRAIDIARKKTGFLGLTVLESIELCFSRMEDCLTRKVPTLRFLARISTLLGFLGTVTGMVEVFNTVAKLGTVTPSDLAAGIHEALFTTIYGLVLAVIAWGLTYLIEAFSRRHLRHLELLVIRELDAESGSSIKGASNENKS